MSDIVRLLDRDPIPVNPDGSYLTDRRVLVTGAGGSIGSELCRQISAWGPKELTLLGHGETSIQSAAATVRCRHTAVLADIRDADRVDEVFANCLPDVVFHVAALKHQPVLEKEPGEAVKSNVWGTANVLAAADKYGVTRLVNVSTDKACDPECVYGASKRIGERMTAWYAPKRFCSVRFGNVLGSAGSVLGVFARQLSSGGPLTLTSPDIDRYFMTSSEAAQFLIQAGVVGLPGQVLVLDMGKPVKIVDIAQRMAAMMGMSPQTVFIGLRPGEKLHEDLIGKDERPTRPSHPLIDQIDVPPMSPSATTAIDMSASKSSIAAILAELCRTVA